MQRSALLATYGLVLAVIFVFCSLALSAAVDGTGDGYDFRVAELDSEGHPIPDSRWWSADYLFNLPRDWGWAAGDRTGYGCDYGFLVRGGRITNLGGKYSWDIVGEKIMLGRFLVVLARPADGAYLWINDHGMVEGRRYFDGTVAPTISQELNSPSWCQDQAPAYGTFTGDPALPKIRFTGPGGFTPEVRDYVRLSFDPDRVYFGVLDSAGGRNGEVAVAAVDRSNDRVAAVVYYRAFNGASVSLED